MPKLDVEPPTNFGMMKVEGPGGLFALMGAVARNYIHLMKHRLRFVWKVLRGKHTLEDAVRDLSRQEGHSAVCKVYRAGYRLRMAQRDGMTSAELDTLRLAFQAECKVFEQRRVHNDFYQRSSHLIPALAPSSMAFFAYEARRRG